MNTELFILLENSLRRMSGADVGRNIAANAERWRIAGLLIRARERRSAEHQLT